MRKKKVENQKSWSRRCPLRLTALLLSGVLVAGSVPGLDFLTSQVQAENRTYYGDVVTAVNTNTAITSDEELLTSVESIGTWSSESVLGDTEEETGILEEEGAGGKCLTMELQEQTAGLLPELPQSDMELRSKSESYVEGATKTFYSDLAREGSFEATCRAVGETCTIWVASEYSDQVTQEMLQIYLDALDGKITKQLWENYGTSEPVDVDKDGKVAFAFYPFVMDGVEVPNILGFFYACDLFTKEQTSYATGNVMDMLNINLTSVLSGDSQELTLATIAHEYQHLINYAMTNGNSEAWLNEAFSESAQAVAWNISEEAAPEINQTMRFINNYGYSFPFVFGSDYVPGGSMSGYPYGQWYLFGRYLAAQTRKIEGGGDSFYKQVLEYGKSEDSYGSCTTESLMAVLERMGYSSINSVDNFETLLMNYSQALLLRRASGVYCIGDEGAANQVDGIALTPIQVKSYADSKKFVLGGGSAVYVAVDDNATPTGYGPNVRFSGEELVPRVECDKNEDVMLCYSDTITLTSELADGEIYYTLDQSDPTDWENTARVQYSGPITAGTAQNLKACVYDAANDRYSQTSEYTFAIEVDPVTATVSDGVVAAGTEIELQCATPGAVICYTPEEGDIVYENAVKYTAPVRISKDTTIRAWSIMEGETEIYDSRPSTFTWQVETTESGDQYEANETVETATAMSFPAVVNATLHTAKDVDVYQFEVVNKENLSLTLTSPADTMYKLTLYDGEKKEIKTSEHKESSQNIRYTDATSGIYYAEVKSLDESYSNKNTYQLNLTREMNEEQVSALNLSEQNLVTALTDTKNSSIAREGGANGGGSNFDSLSYYSSWAGPVSEDEDPYDGNVYTPETIDEKYQYKNLSEDALYHVQNALILPAGTEETYVSNMKNAIYSYGAVSARVEWWTAYATSDDKNLFVDDMNHPLSKDNSDGGGHIITVVGWDDEYAKENFKGNPKYVKETLQKDPSELKLPERDGAFICKNSWGTETASGQEIGDGGYFYVSYEDAIMPLVNGFIFMGDELPDNYNHQYYNDTKGFVASYQDSRMISTSEVFKNESDQAELLRAVSFQTGSANMRYEIAVRQGDTIQKVAEGKKKYGGFYTERLSKPLLVEAGSEFEVIVHMENEEGGQASIAITMNYEGDVSGVEAVPGKAYIYFPDGTNSRREDMGAEGYYPCIRAYTYDVEQAGYQTTTLAEASLGTETADASGENNQGAEDVTDDYVSTASVEAVTERGEAAPGYNPVMEKVEEANGAASPEVNLPSKFDLRTTETLTAVRDQKALGSCWAFAATASMESSIARNGGAAVEYPQSLTLSDSQKSVLLDAENTEAAVNLQATLEGATHVSSEKIFWSVTGDTESVKLNQTTSMNGEEIPVITAVKPGIVTVTAASDADMTLTASCKVTITSQGVESLTLTPSELKLKTGDTEQLTALVEPENAIDKTVLYESNHPEIASVDANGKVTAISGGEATITAYAGTASATAKVTVTGKEAEKPGNNGTDGTGGGSNNSATSKTSTPLTSAANPVASTVKSVITGDQTAILIWVLVGVAAVGVASTLVWKRRRKH